MTDHIVKSYDNELKRLDGEIQRVAQVAAEDQLGLPREPDPVIARHYNDSVVR